MSNLSPDPTRLPGRVLAGAGMGGLAVLTLAERGATQMYATPQVWILVTILATAPLALLLRIIASPRTWQAPTLPWLMAAGLLGGGPVVSALFSPYRGPALQSAAIPLAAACLFLLVHDWLRADEPARQNQLLRLLAFGTALVTVVSLVQWLRSVASLSLEDALSSAVFFMRNPHPLGHANYTAGLMLLALPSTTWLAYRSAGWLRVVMGGCALLAALNLFTSGSRGGLLGLAALAIAGLAVARVGWKRFLLLGGAAALAAALLAVANPRVRSLLGSPDPSAAPNASTVQRVAMAKAAWLMGVERPLFGWGPGATPLAYPRFRHALDGGAESVLQMHNTPLHLWAEQGGVGLIGAGLMAALAAVGWRRSPLAAATLAGYGAFSLTDYQLDVPVFAATLAAAAALLASPAAAPVSRGARFGIGLLIVAAAAAIGLLGSRDRAPALNVEALQLAREPMRHAEAVARFKESLALNPHQELAHFNLGWLLLVPEPAAAEGHFLAAARLVPDKGGVYFGLGLARLNQGNRAGAAFALALECVNEPLFLSSPWWTVPEIATLREETAHQFSELLTRAYPTKNSLVSWDERQATLLKTLTSRLGQVSPGPETNYRRTRIGYPVLMRNADLAPAVDLYDVREDPRFPASVPFPLPPKGWLPSPRLLNLLDAAPASRQ